MNFRQKENNKNIDIKDLSNQIGLSEITTTILVNRGLDRKEKIVDFLNPTEKDLIDPFLLNNMDKVVEKIKNAVRERKRILIFGDYDVDGISAVAILYKYFEKNKLKVDYFLPNRYEDGYGLTLETAEKVIEEFNPELIITVDCGITCYKEIEFLKSKGVDVVVTDHHEIPEILPDCLVINAKIPNQKYGFTQLCGAGVAFKIVQALGENIYEYLPIAAIATVADIVDLTNENRAIVVLGLKSFENVPQGIKLLLKELKINVPTSQDIAYKIAPKINAAGRMGDATIALKLFILKNSKELFENLVKLTAMNVERQQLCNKIYEDAVNRLGIINSNKQKCIILQSKEWDSGLLGIVCARLVEDYNKPTFLFSNVNGKLTGSVRSINGINIHSALSMSSNLLEKFGGHSMAAGLTLNIENYEKFKQEMINYFENNFSEENLVCEKEYDLKLDTKDITLSLAKELKKLEPFGCGNPMPLFLVEWEKSIVKPMGNFPNHINIILNNNLSLVAFNSAEYTQNIIYSKVKRALIELQINNFNKKESVRCLVKNLDFYEFNKIGLDVANGNYLKQVFTKTKFEGFINYEENIYTRIKECLTKSNYGTLIVVNNPANIEKVEKAVKEFSINYCIGRVHCKNSINSIVVNLSSFENVLNYKNIIFVEPVIIKEYLSNFKGKIFVPKNERFLVKMLNINLDRDYMLKIYKAILQNTAKINANNENDYYLQLKKFCPNLKDCSYAQFVLSLKIFEELNLIIIDTTSHFDVRVVDGVKSNLENSYFYNKVKYLINIK